MNTIIALCILATVTVAKAGYSHGGFGDEYEGHDGIGFSFDGHGGGDSGHEDYHTHPKYNFNYAVHDLHTGDDKQHHEERDGDEVKGSYMFKEADGTTRIVEYKADKHNGFNAVVHKIGTPNHGNEGGGGHEGHY